MAFDILSLLIVGCHPDEPQVVTIRSGAESTSLKLCPVNFIQIVRDFFQCFI